MPIQKTQQNTLSQQIITRPTPSQHILNGLSPLLTRLYTARGITRAEQLDYSLARLPSYVGLKGITQAAEYLAQAIAQQRTILIVGDYDTDGATSTALAIQALQAMGAQQVDYFIPHRAHHGYGLTPQAVAAIAQRGYTPGLLLTVDNGITSHAGVAAAQQAGWQVIITDHHLPGTDLPSAEAIVNPNQPEGGAFAKNLAGVGVVFYVMAALRGYLRQQGRAQLPNLGHFLDLVALGTVADMVKMDDLNRLLVAQGLRRIQNDHTRPGIKALAEAAGRQWQRLIPEDIGFGIAPRLNAAGRIEDMREGVACLLAADLPTARRYAEQLSLLNQQRRDLQAEMQTQAEQALAQYTCLADTPAALVVYEPTWHEGIVGLVAGKLCEHYQRPVIAFAQLEDGTLLKGSARAPNTVHIRDLLAQIDAEQPELIQRFGGHARAAGLTLAAAQLDAFKQALQQVAAAAGAGQAQAQSWVTDGQLTRHQLNLQTAWQLRKAGPWGHEFPAPKFYGRFKVLATRVLKDKHLKLNVAPCDGGAPLEAIAFNQTPQLAQGDEVTLVYQLAVNHFRGQDSPNLMVEHIQA